MWLIYLPKLNEASCNVFQKWWISFTLFVHCVFKGFSLLPILHHHLNKWGLSEFLWLCRVFPLSSVGKPCHCRRHLTMTHSTISLNPKLQFELLDNLKITPGGRQKEKTADMNKEKKDTFFFILNCIKFH